MISNKKGLVFGALAGVAFVLAGCGGGSGSSDMTGTTGLLSLGVSDGPVDDALKVCIEFSEIEIKGEGPSEVIFLGDPEDPNYEPTRVNLLEFQGNNAQPILTSHELPAGEYQWMRLGINADRGGNGGVGDSGAGVECEVGGSYIIKEDGLPYNLYVPSSANNGLKLVGGITVPANRSVSLTAEFDLRKSITAPPGLDPDVVMRPTIRLVNNIEVGTLTGQVANDLVMADGCAPFVYVFDDGVTPNGIEDLVDDHEDPVATAMLEEQPQDDGSVQYHYTIGFLLAGDYEVAFTCNNADFEPADGEPATIVVGELETVDIEAPPPTP